LVCADVGEDSTALLKVIRNRLIAERTFDHFLIALDVLAQAANDHTEGDEKLHDEQLEELERVQIARVVRLVDLLDCLENNNAEEDDTDLLPFVEVTHEGYGRHQDYLLEINHELPVEESLNALLGLAARESHLHARSNEW